MVDDDRRIRDDHAAVVDERQFTSRSLARIRRDLDFVGDARDP
jgi:hypothetical protein